MVATPETPQPRGLREQSKRVAVAATCNKGICLKVVVFFVYLQVEIDLGYQVRTA